MRWLLLIVFLCVAARLARCQATRWSNMATDLHQRTVKGEYRPDYGIEDDRLGGGLRPIDDTQEPEFYQRIGSYRRNRAIDDSR